MEGGSKPFHTQVAPCSGQSWSGWFPRLLAVFSHWYRELRKLGLAEEALNTSPGLCGSLTAPGKHARIVRGPGSLFFLLQKICPAQRTERAWHRG